MVGSLFVHAPFFFFFSSGKLDLLAGDAAVLDYMRANDPGCTLQSAGSDLIDDTFAVGMPKGFPLKVTLRTLYLLLI